MAVAYVLQHPKKPKDDPASAITLTVFERVIVTKIGNESLTQKFPSAKKANEHLQRVIFLRQQDGYALAETREADSEPPDTEIPPELAMTFEAASNRMSMTFSRLDRSDWSAGKPNLIKTFPAKTLKAISARLQKTGPRCVQVLCDPESPGPQLAKMLPPSLEALIFDTHYETVSRQSLNTLGDIAEVLNACPNLKRAFVTGCSTMRKTRHEHLQELYLIGDPLPPSAITALGASEFPALETLAISTGDVRTPGGARLAKALRSIAAPLLARVYVEVGSVTGFLSVVGTAPLPWNLCATDSGFEGLTDLLELLDKREALRSQKLCVDLGGIPSDSEIAQLQERGVATVEARKHFSPEAYRDW